MFRTIARAGLSRAALTRPGLRMYSSGVRNQPLNFKLYTLGVVSVVAVGLSFSDKVSNDDSKHDLKKDVVLTESQETPKEQQPAGKEPTEKESKPEPESSESENSENPEGEGHQSAAFNPETGEINWDCPCLGGMAHGPCGEEFKAAFACFVYSETEPKGIDCIKKFEAMRTCFRQYPEHYKEELYEDDEVPEADSKPAEPNPPKPESAESTPVAPVTPAKPKGEATAPEPAAPEPKN